MKMHAYVAGVGMTRFGNHLTVKLKDLAAEAIREALVDSGLSAGDLQAAYMGTASAGVIQGQERILGQAVLHSGGAIDDFIRIVFNLPPLGDAYKYAAYDGLQALAKSAPPSR